ncbi:hypothetical protein [Paracoccus sp. pheM1]|uniref:hypothetical protein n=1 Tax=Paracoccus sp. pheM1 TaxID=2831675 RepID=UPI001BDB7515|nr:hypothetical protein [Paracoccus sp. pheM1]MBT0780552.1 hypothetical protein [Paracoccus sp. pheM1]
MTAPIDHKRRFIAAIRTGRLDIGDAARRAGLTFRDACEVWAEGVAAKRLAMAEDVPGFRHIVEVGR